MSTSSCYYGQWYSCPPTEKWNTDYNCISANIVAVKAASMMTIFMNIPIKATKVKITVCIAFNITFKIMDELIKTLNMDDNIVIIGFNNVNMINIIFSITLAIKLTMVAIIFNTINIVHEFENIQNHRTDKNAGMVKLPIIWTKYRHCIQQNFTCEPHRVFTLNKTS